MQIVSLVWVVEMSIAAELLQKHIQTLVDDHQQWQTLWHYEWWSRQDSRSVFSVIIVGCKDCSRSDVRGL